MPWSSGSAAERLARSLRGDLDPRSRALLDAGRSPLPRTVGSGDPADVRCKALRMTAAQSGEGTPADLRR